MPRKKIPHFRLYIDDFLRGTITMTASEVGDYIRLLCVIYDQNNQVKNDAHVLRHFLGCNRPRETRIRIRRLIELGKLSVDKDGYLHNGRADLEIEKRIVAGTVSEASDSLPAEPKKSMNSRARAQVPVPVYLNSNLKSPSSARDSALRRRSNDWDLPPTPGPRGQTDFLANWKESH